MLNITHEVQDDVLIVSLSGTFCYGLLDSAFQDRDKLEDVLGKVEEKKIIINMRQLEKLSQEGLMVFIRYANENKLLIFVESCHHNVTDKIAMTGLDTFMNIQTNLEDALAILHTA